MSYADNTYRDPMSNYAAMAAADERSNFITKTYLHLAGAIGLFTILETVLLNLPGIDNLVELMIGSRFSWLIVLGAFMLVSYVAENWAQSAVNPSTQYMGLGLYVVAEAVIFVPLLYIARAVDPTIITSAATATLFLFGALTAVVFVTRKDFSFLRIHPGFRRLCSHGLHCCRNHIPVRSGTDLYLRDDCIGLRLYPLPHVECVAPLPHRTARCSGLGIVRLGGIAVLVHFAVIPVPAAIVSLLKLLVGYKNGCHAHACREHGYYSRR